MKHLEAIPSDVRSPDVSTLRPAREFFYDPLPGHGFHRFCRFCYENPDDIPKCLEPWRKPGREIKGCIQYNASPGALQRHLRRMHDVETVVFREENYNGKRDIEEVAQQMNTSKTGDAAREKTAILEPDAKRLKKIGIHE